jgi:hypothetical protein
MSTLKLQSLCINAQIARKICTQGTYCRTSSIPTIFWLNLKDISNDTTGHLPILGCSTDDKIVAHECLQSCAAEQRDEHAPVHSITSSARGQHSHQAESSRSLT